MDPELTAFATLFRRFLDDVVQRAGVQSELTPLGLVVETHMGVDIGTLPTVSETISGHRLVDVDLAMTEIMSRSTGRVVGVSLGQSKWHEDFATLLKNPYARFDVAPVEFASVASGFDEELQVVAFGVRLFSYAGHPVTVLQRAARPENGREHGSLEILASTPEAASGLIREIRELMVSRSVLKGKVLSFTGNEFGQTAAGATFLPRPEVAASEIVLAEGLLDRVRRHVVGIGDHRERLIAAGQHLKRGVLLYGPPGTGKTLTVRHLITATPGTTVVLLTGSSIRFVQEAAELARAMQPSIVVLEDVDVIASDRTMHGPQPLLFTVLDALDGLDGDADVTFLLTTNRVELLERALAERPGRVDLAVEVGLPDASARRRIFELYARGLPFSTDAVIAAADRADGVTGSFARELMRRAVLVAAEESRAPTDADLADQLESLLDDAEALTRSLLGSPPAPEEGATGWVAYTGGGGPVFEV